MQSTTPATGKKGFFGRFLAKYNTTEAELIGRKIVEETLSHGDDLISQPELGDKVRLWGRVGSLTVKPGGAAIDNEITINDGTAHFTIAIPKGQTVGILGSTIEVEGTLAKDHLGRYILTDYEILLLTKD